MHTFQQIQDCHPIPVLQLPRFSEEKVRIRLCQEKKRLPARQLNALAICNMPFVRQTLGH